MSNHFTNVSCLLFSFLPLNITDIEDPRVPPVLLAWIEQELDLMRTYRMEVDAGSKEKAFKYELRSMAFLQLVLKLVC